MTYALFTGTKAPFYEVTDPEVAQTVNLAVRLGRPLLVEGEAGCGKTRLASAIAHELGLAAPIAVTVKSTSQAKDLLYRFDALRRLQDIQNPESQEARFVYPYIRLQPLGRALYEGKPCVILIDEVDKADIDFPNDLLEVLDAFAFDIDDLPDDTAEIAACRKLHGFGRRVESQGDVRPIVVITSNREKQLPEPFLRRCLYVELKFPKSPDVLALIVGKNLQTETTRISEELIVAAVAKFLEVRDEAETIGTQKPPATSELVDWVRALHWQGHSASTLEAAGRRPPWWKILFKTMQDLDAYDRRTGPSETPTEDNRS